MGKGQVPDRWNNYAAIGKPLNGVRIIAFKVPLRPLVNPDDLDDSHRLDIDILTDKIPNLGLVIDLTNTYKYYDIKALHAKGVEHEKIMVPGHFVPPLSLRNAFKDRVKQFLDENSDNDKLIGVHCTHGVNRTGLMICHYLVAELKMDPMQAINCVETARGYPIERENYRQCIMETGRHPTESSSYGQTFGDQRTHGPSRNDFQKIPDRRFNANSRFDGARMFDHRGNESWNSYDQQNGQNWRSNNREPQFSGPSWNNPNINDHRAFQQEPFWASGRDSNRPSQYTPNERNWRSTGVHGGGRGHRVSHFADNNRPQRSRWGGCSDTQSRPTPYDRPQRKQFAPTEPSAKPTPDDRPQRKQFAPTEPAARPTPNDRPQRKQFAPTEPAARPFYPPRK